jgi:hypothetical protein
MDFIPECHDYLRHFSEILFSKAALQILIRPTELIVFGKALVLALRTFRQHSTPMDTRACSIP